MEHGCRDKLFSEIDFLFVSDRGDRYLAAAFGPNFTIKSKTNLQTTNCTFMYFRQFGNFVDCVNFFRAITPIFGYTHFFTLHACYNIMQLKLYMCDII